MSSSNTCADVKSPQTMPHMEFVDRMWKIPTIQSAWSCSTSTYNKIKECNSMFNWGLSTAEMTVQKALEHVGPIAIPYINVFETPIHLADQALCKGLTTVENKIPIVTETPEKIYEDAKQKLTEALQPTVDKSASQVNACKDYGTQKAIVLKQMSWEKANEVLATQYGNMAANGVVSTAALADRLLDNYFPPIGEETENDDAPISPETDRALHTVQTVGRLSNKVARRVYRTISNQVQTLKKEDIQEYVASLVAILQLTQYLTYVNEKVNAITGKPIDDSNTEAATKSELNAQDKKTDSPKKE